MCHQHTDAPTVAYLAQNATLDVEKLWSHLVNQGCPSANQVPNNANDTFANKVKMFQNIATPTHGLGETSTKSLKARRN